MSRSRRIEGCVLTSGGWIRGGMEFSHRVEGFFGQRVSAPGPLDDVLLPGFIDLHVHGAAGADVMDGGTAVERIARLHARHGTTSLLATTVTADAAAMRNALAAVGDVMRLRPGGTANLLGVHVEGPYINQERLGAQPPHARAASLDELRAWQALAPVRIVTLAPELAGHLEFVRELKRLGIVAQCGHTMGTYEDGVAALMAGVRGFTHLFNAMTGLEHRKPGMVGAALAHAQFAELIPDLLHVHPGAIRAAMRAIPNLYCVTDSTAATGMPDGEYRLGSHTVSKCMGGVRLRDGTLAGSTLTMDQALRNLVDIGVPLDDAARRLSTYPANYIGEPNRGRLERGTAADVVVLTHELNVKAVYVEGDPIDLLDA